jgi:hypothetical protein
VIGTCGLDWAWVWEAHCMEEGDIDLLAAWNARPPEWRAERPLVGHVMGTLQVRFNLAVRAGRLDEGWVPLHRADVWVRGDAGPVPYGRLP